MKNFVLMLLIALFLYGCGLNSRGDKSSIKVDYTVEVIYQNNLLDTININTDGNHEILLHEGCIINQNNYKGGWKTLICGVRKFNIINQVKSN
jgi:hypothetical protein